MHRQHILSLDVVMMGIQAWQHMELYNASDVIEAIRNVCYN